MQRADPFGVHQRRQRRCDELPTGKVGRRERLRGRRPAVGVQRVDADLCSDGVGHHAHSLATMHTISIVSIVSTRPVTSLLPLVILIRPRRPAPTPKRLPRRIPIVIPNMHQPHLPRHGPHTTRKPPPFTLPEHAHTLPHRRQAHLPHLPTDLRQPSQQHLPPIVQTSPDPILIYQPPHVINPQQQIHIVPLLVGGHILLALALVPPPPLRRPHAAEKRLPTFTTLPLTDTKLRTHTPKLHHRRPRQRPIQLLVQLANEQSASRE